MRAAVTYDAGASGQQVDNMWIYDDGALDLDGRALAMTNMYIRTLAAGGLTHNGGSLEVTNQLQAYGGTWTLGTNDSIYYLDVRGNTGALGEVTTSASTNVTYRVFVSRFNNVDGTLILGDDLNLSSTAGGGSPAVWVNIGGVLRTEGFDITGTNIWCGGGDSQREGTIISGPGSTFTADMLQAVRESQITVKHQVGLNGLTLDGLTGTPDVNLDATSNFLLEFDPLSGGTDWAFRWEGSHTSTIDTWLTDGWMTYTGIDSVKVLENGGYTYVMSGIPEPATMGLLLIGGIGALLKKRRRRREA